MFEAYAAVERTYSQGRYDEALKQAEALLVSLANTADEPLRPRLQLLVGHCHLYGLANPAAAAAAYRAVLATCQEPVLREIADEGLGRCRATEAPSAEAPTAQVPTTATAPPPTAAATPATASASPAMPWLERLDSQASPSIEPAAVALAPFQRPAALNTTVSALASAPVSERVSERAAPAEALEEAPTTTLVARAEPERLSAPEAASLSGAEPVAGAEPVTEAEPQPEPELIIPELIAPPEPEPPGRSGGFSREEEEELARGLLLVEL